MPTYWPFHSPISLNDKGTSLNRSAFTYLQQFPVALISSKRINVAICLKMKVDATYIYWRCFNVDKTTLKQRWYNNVDSTSTNQRCLNVEIWLKMKVEPTYVYRRFLNIDKTTLIELRWLNVDDPMLFQRWC